MDNIEALGRLPVPTINGTVEFIEIGSIEYLKSNGQTTKIFTDSREIVGFEILGEFEERLKNLPFKRVHQQYIINLAKIEKCTKDDVLILHSGVKIQMSRRKKGEVIHYLLNKGHDELTIKAIAFLIIDYKKANAIIEPIQAKKQLVGRKSPSSKNDISVDNGDASLSRSHFFIDVDNRPEGKYRFLIYPHDPEKIVLVGRKVIKQSEKHELLNNSIIKAGKTTFLFTNSLEEIT